MTELIAALFGLAIGAIVVFVVSEGRRREAKAAAAKADLAAEQLREVAAERESVRQEAARVSEQAAKLAARVVALQDLERENAMLKVDLRNIGVAVRKQDLDHARLDEERRSVDMRGEELARSYLGQVEKWVAQSISANNYAANKQRLIKAINECREIGYEISQEREDQLLEELKRDFEEEVRKQLQREEQARIKARIREEQAREREVQRELQKIERERAVLEEALARALAEAKDQHSAEIESLRARLAEAESRQRSVAQAQLTKAGHIYVISNIGSFGEGVFKIGMTRRLEPMERISELGDASVPFPFDVHMMIAADNAPELENKLHKACHNHRVNKVNPRKEYFRVPFEMIRQVVEESRGEVKFVQEPEAAEYRQSLTMSAEDQAYIERVFEQAGAGMDETED